jgi:hypothetical protein
MITIEITPFSSLVAAVLLVLAPKYRLFYFK